MVGRIFLGRYETIRLLGEGGMGRVYLARQSDLGRQVVVKVMHEHIASDPKFRDRFQRETLVMARFQHPYVVTLYDASLNDPEGPCIVMEYIRGISLDTMLRKNKRFSPQRFNRLLGQLCEALQAAHGEGIIHRDLKPGNLMVVDADTPYEKIKVMDFGLAKMVPHRNQLKQLSDTNVEFAVGTPGYISPEQVRGDGMDHRSDLYSVGVILYEMLTGQLPFSGTETMDVLLAHATLPPPTFEELGLGNLIPQSVEDIVQKCLAKNPDDRPQSARDLAEAYEEALFEEQLTGIRTNTPIPDQDSDDFATHNGDSLGNTPMPSKMFELRDDPSAMVQYLEAWMPEAIAAYKLRGFVDDVGGEVIESVPGKIRVRLGGRDCNYRFPAPGAWLGFRKRNNVEMELHLERNHPKQQSLLSITAVIRSSVRGATSNPEWRSCCNEIFCDLRAYLMGNGVSAM